MPGAQSRAEAIRKTFCFPLRNDITDWGLCFWGPCSFYQRLPTPRNTDTSSLTVSQDGQENCNLAVVQGYEHTVRLITCPCLSHCAPAQRVGPQRGKPQPGGPGGPARPRHALVSAGPPQPRTLFLAERLDPFLHGSASRPLWEVTL